MKIFNNGHKWDIPIIARFTNPYGTGRETMSFNEQPFALIYTNNGIL